MNTGKSIFFFADLHPNSIIWY